jgi:hypothetical protein
MARRGQDCLGRLLHPDVAHFAGREQDGSLRALLDGRINRQPADLPMTD